MNAGLQPRWGWLLGYLISRVGQSFGITQSRGRSRCGTSGWKPFRLLTRKFFKKTKSYGKVVHPLIFGKMGVKFAGSSAAKAAQTTNPIFKNTPICPTNFLCPLGSRAPLPSPLERSHRPLATGHGGTSNIKHQTLNRKHQI